ncbi:MAG: hypothetical protein CSB34_06045 [Desulfobulbus propionicus]|nr:MAG: hypothetical protein CSB34_06045 [Desulfobulbus propionicus]
MKQLIILVFILFTSPSWAAITTLTVQEKAGVTTTNYPLTFGHVFKKGDAVGTVSVKVNGVAVNTQCDIRNRYEDNSIRFAVISLLVPSMPANGSVTLTLESGGTNYNTNPMAKAEIQATGIDAELRLTGLSGSGYSGNLTADLSTAIANDTNLTYWMSGDIATEIIVEQRLNNSLNAVWEARFYPGTPYIRLSHTIENIEANYRGNVDYALDIRQGTSSLPSVYTKPSFTHNNMGRWRKVLWVENEPPEIEMHYNLPYLISTGHIPNYDTTLTVPETTISDSYAQWQGTDTDIMGTGYIETFFGATGGREDIGFFPTWTARYLLSMDNRMREIMMNHAEMVAGAPFHWREFDSTKSFFGSFVNIDDRPRVYTIETYVNSPGFDKLGTAIGTTSSEWSLDRSHQASFTFVPYLITGDYFYFQETQYWAAWDLSASNYNADWGRNYDKGYICDQVRGEAWGLRNIAHAAVISPDGSAAKAYFTEKVVNNIPYQLNLIQNKYPNFHNSGRMTNTDSQHKHITADVKYVTSPWMEDFKGLVLSELRYLGFDTSPVMDVYNTYFINRFTPSVWNAYLGFSYRFPLILEDGTALQTWPEAAKKIVKNTRNSYSETYAFGYASTGRAVVSTLTNYPGGLAAYNWINNNVTWGQTPQGGNMYADDPTWALVPRTISHIPTIKSISIK